jgi:polar amino acid transport system ATP-binding protein
MTMVIATHEVGFARQIADRVCFLYEGRDPRARPAGAALRTPREERSQAFLKRVTEAGRAADLTAAEPGGAAS